MDRHPHHSLHFHIRVPASFGYLDYVFSPLGYDLNFLHRYGSTSTLARPPARLIRRMGTTLHDSR